MKKNECQRPKRAFLISTNNTIICNSVCQQSVNALNGLFLFLH